jgi:hypothetical protein
MARQISWHNLVGIALAAGALVAGVLLLVLWPRGICDLSPCTLNPPGPGAACITVRIIGPCPVTAYTIALPLVAGFVAAAVVMASGAWERRRRDHSPL